MSKYFHFENNIDLSSVNNLHDYYEILRKLKPKIGWLGGRRFFFHNDGNTVCVNDLVKKLSSLVKETLDKNKNHFTASEKLYAGLTFHHICYLDNEAYRLLDDKIQTSFFKRGMTRLRTFSNLFYDRIKNLKDILKSVREAACDEVPIDKDQILAMADRATLLHHLDQILNSPKKYNISYFKGLYQSDRLNLENFFDVFSIIVLNKSDPKELAILKKFIFYYPGKMSVTYLKRLGFDLESDREVFIACFQNCMKKGFPLLAMNALQEMGISLQKVSDIEIWKAILSLCPCSHISEMLMNLKNCGADPLENRQLQTYIGLVQHCHEIQPLDFSHIDETLGLGTNTFQELKVLTHIISALSVKGEEDKNVRKFLDAKRIKGVIPAEQEYFQWLSGSVTIQENGKNASPLEQMPLDLLKIIMEELDLKSLVTLLSTLKTSSPFMKAAWLSLLGQDRSKIPNHGNVRDFVNLMSPHSILENVRLYGSDIRKLNLTGIFYFDPNAKERQQEQLKVLEDVLKFCPDLITLRMADSGVIDDEVMALFPKTLHHLNLEKCPVISLNNLPKEILLLIVHRLETNVAVDVPSLLGLRINGMINATNLNQFQKCENLIVLNIGSIESKEVFKALCSHLPANLEVLRVGNLWEPDIIMADEFYSCMDELSKQCLKLHRLLLPSVPVFLNTTTIRKFSQYEYIEQMFCCWDGQLKELFSCLPKNLKFLFLKPDNHKFIDDDIDKIPRSLETLAMQKKDVQLSEAGQKALKDRDVELLWLN